MIISEFRTTNKKQIKNERTKKIIFIFLLVIFKLNFLFCQNEFKNIKLINLYGDEISLNDSIPTNSIIMYYSEPICSGCVSAIIDLINEKQIKNFYIIIEDRNDIMYRKIKVKDFKNRCGFIKSIYFDDRKLKLPFSEKIIKTKDYPYLIFYNNKIQVFSSNKIFENNINNFNFDINFLTKLNDFLKIQTY